MSESALCFTCACAVGQGDVIGDGDVGRQGGVEVLSITDWVAWRCTVVEIEMLEAGSGKQGGLGVEDGGGQEEDGDERGEEDDGADKGGAFEQAAVIR